MYWLLAMVGLNDDATTLAMELLKDFGDTIEKLI
jgi:hypothetical protein